MSPLTAMGAAARRVVPATAPGRRTAGRGTARPGLKLVPSASPRAARAPFVALVMMLLVGGLVGLLVLSTTLQQGAFAVHDVELETSALRNRQQALVEEVARRESPVELAARATALGMQPNRAPAFLQLPEGTLVGPVGETVQP